MSAAIVALATVAGILRMGAGYTVRFEVAPEPILSLRQGNSDWAQVFNPTYVAPAPGQSRGGLLVRSQNCTIPAGKCGPTCAGTGQKASWLTFAELAAVDPETFEAAKVKPEWVEQAKTLA